MNCLSHDLAITVAFVWYDMSLKKYHKNYQVTLCRILFQLHIHWYMVESCNLDELGMGINRGGGGHNVKCPPPPMILGLYDYSYKWGPFLAPRCMWTFFFFFACQRGWWCIRWVPLLCVWKIDPKNFWGRKKKVSVRVVSPPPPPPPPHGLVRIGTHGAGAFYMNICFNKFKVLHLTSLLYFISFIIFITHACCANHWKLKAGALCLLIQVTKCYLSCYKRLEPVFVIQVLVVKWRLIV